LLEDFQGRRSLESGMRSVGVALNPVLLLRMYTTWREAPLDFTRYG
jgi:hypothetical protein